MEKNTRNWILLGPVIAVALTVLGMTVEQVFESPGIVTLPRIGLIVFMSITGLFLGYLTGRRTDRHMRSARALEQAGATINALVESAPLPILSLSTDGTISHLWNPTARQILANAHGRRFMDFVAPGQEAVIEILQNALAQKSAFDGLEMQILRPDKSSAACLAYGRPLEGFLEKDSGHVLVLVDRSEQKKAQEALDIQRRQLLSIFDSIDEPITVTDPVTYELLYINKAVKKQWGECIGEKCYEALQGLCEPCPWCTNDSLFGENAVDTYIWQHYNEKIGRWYRCTDKVIRWTDGRFVRFEMALDITERVRTDEMLKEAHEEIKQAYARIQQDMAHRRAAEARLAESESRYRLLAQNIHDGIWTIDENLCFTFISPSHDRLVGYPMEELIGKPSSFLVAAENRKKTLAGLERAVKIFKETGKPFELKPQELEIVRKDGTRLWVEIQTSFLQDENGQFMGFVGVTRNISDRKKAQQALAHSEAKYRDLVENAADIIYTVDPNGVFMEVNRAFLEEGGWQVTDIIGKNFNFMLHPDDVEVAINAYTAGLSGQNVAFEMRSRRKDGTYGYYSFTNRPLYDGDGVVVALHGIARNISARKQAEDALRDSEARYRTLFETGPDAIFLVDPVSGAIQDANAAAVRLLGKDRQDMIGMHHSKLHPEEYAPENEARLAQFQSIPNPDSARLSWTSFVVDAFDKEIPVEISGQMIRIHNRPALQFIVRDISLRKKMEEEIVKARKLEAMALLAGGIAHDFNNLLTVILSGIEISQTQAKNQNAMLNHLDEARTACLRARDLTRRFITFSTGGAPATKAVSPEKLLLEAVKLVPKDNGLQVELNLAPNLWDMEADENQVLGALADILNNAKEAMGGRGKLVIDCENVLVNGADNPATVMLLSGRFVHIAVVDCGCGILAADLPRIFDPYFSTKQRGATRGMGMGLTVAGSIIKKHGGAIDVQSVYGEGTTVHLYLPAAKVKPNDPPLPGADS
ncbi:MAG: PAS domain S-box protein [Desulfatibacillaceae bacterium]|nr:PAS domain S-box protein [Desulfatibacillaceae bacterium]